jgi:hypothetical protein
LIAKKLKRSPGAIYARINSFVSRRGVPTPIGELSY